MRFPRIHRLLSLAVIVIGLQLLFGIFILVPVAANCSSSLPNCSLVNLNPYVGALYIVFGSVSYFGVGGEVVKNKRWFLTVLSFIPILAAFIEFDLTQGGPFGTFKVGGIVLEHEGFGIGMLLGAFFFKTGTRLFQGAAALGAILIIVEYQINQLADLYNNPFGIFFSSLVGLFMTYAVFRAFGYREQR